MKNIIQSVKGTRDFYPEDMAVRNWLYRMIGEVSSAFGYQEYEGPIIERIDLYAAKSGEELVKEQAFVFNDRGGELITLRPELTPTLARMVAQQQNGLGFPLRWWSYGPFWRYERPQKGRTREFFQWNIDLIGANSTDVDAELIAIAAEFLRRVGLTSDKVKIFVNDRRLMDSLLIKIGITGELKGNAFRMIDRKDKMSPSEWEAYGINEGMTLEQIQKLKEMLLDGNLWKESESLTRVFSILERMGYGDTIQFDAGVIRGLEYYTGTVFEARHLTGEGRAVLGGGHYDNLVSDVGGDPLPGVGFAMGDVMITFLLRKYELIPQTLLAAAPVMVSIFDETKLEQSYALAAELRQNGLQVAVYPEPAKLPKQMKYADRIGVRLVIIEGPDEEEKGVVTVKDLKNRTQEIIEKKDAGIKIKEMLARQPTL